MDISGKRIHFLGASGMGVLPLALYAKGLGANVSAEDDAMSEDSRDWLDESGILVSDFDSLEGECAILVHSTAMSSSDLRIGGALSKGVKVYRRGSFLAALASERKLVAIAGSHGKTTTTAMLVDALQAMEVPCSYVLGGRYRGNTAPAGVTDAPWLVAEIDESDGTIESFEPEITLILNVDHDHHALYENAESYAAALRGLALKTKRLVIVSEQAEKELGLSGSDMKAQLITLGGKLEASFNCRETFRGCSQLSLSIDGVVSEVAINRSSRFDVSNAALALLTAKCISPITTLPATVLFRPLQRRQACDFLSPELAVYNDYAHHPSEIEAQLTELKRLSDTPIIVVFQPHRYSRTKRLRDEFARSLEGCEKVYLLDVYSAGEDNIEGGSSNDLRQTFESHGLACAKANDQDALLADLLERADCENARFLFLGAGITDTLADEFADALASKLGTWGSVYRAIGKQASYASRIVAGEALAPKTTMRVGGRAAVYVEPLCEEELAAVVSAATAKGLPARLLGRGSNLIVPDEGVEGLVIRLSHPYWRQVRRIGDNKLWVGAGLRIKELCGFAMRHGLQGFEFLEGIPGSVGGALRMNAGAMGGWMFDVVESVRYLSEDGEIVASSKEKMSYGYRYCRELENAVALGAILVSAESGKQSQDIRDQIGTYQELRHDSQPKEPSAGCIFKNPDGDSAGRLIDALGLKGTSVGGAKFSEKHGNFIVNTGGASSKDVIELIKLARRVALDKKRIELEPEAILYGGEWKDALR